MRRKQHTPRTLSELFTLGQEIGNENVLLTDAELGVVLAGSDAAPIAAGTISNYRSYGRLPTPTVRFGRDPKTRLSDALALLERRTDRGAAA